MHLNPIKVQCHSGYKADEYPVSFILDGEEFPVSGIIDRWYQGDRDPKTPVADYFKVIVASGRQFLLKHEIIEDVWYMIG
jgi:hypothetical protein